MNRDGVIYAIKHKSSVRYCYIGQTRLKPETRWRAYLNGKTLMAQAIQMLGALDEFDFHVLEKVKGDELNSRERFWIAHHGTLFPDGLNRTTGGSSGNLSAATRALIGASHRGSKRSEETKRRMSEAIKATLSRPDVRKKISDSAKKRASLPEEKLIRSERAKRHMCRPEIKQMLKDKQRPVDERTRANMREAAALRMAQEGAKEKVSSSLTELWKNPEYKAKMCQAQQRRWARRSAEKSQHVCAFGS